MRNSREQQGTKRPASKLLYGILRHRSSRGALGANSAVPCVLPCRFVTSENEPRHGFRLLPPSTTSTPCSPSASSLGSALPLSQLFGVSPPGPTRSRMLLRREELFPPAGLLPTLPRSYSAGPP